MITGDSIDGGDFISSLPDVILHHILSSVSTKSAIRTSVLSKRWRYVWSETPSLSIDCHRANPNSIDKTLTSFSAPKITAFHLRTSLHNRVQPINGWIEFAISRDAEKLSFEFRDSCVRDYKFPDFFYANSSVKQLFVNSGAVDLVPRCAVSWASLKNLSLSFCTLSDESFLKILSGSPLLESLELLYCDEFRCLDLSQSPRLRRLEMDRSDWFMGPTKIVAPHLHYLRLRHSRLPCRLVDVSSLTEADLNIYFCDLGTLTAEFLQHNVVKMLEMLQNVEKLTIGGTFLQMLSLAALCGVPFPTLKVKTLTLETMIIRSVIPGITELLRNTSGLRKLTIHTVKCSSISELHLNAYLRVHSLNQHQCWRSKDSVFPGSLETISMLVGKHAESNLVALFMERLLESTKSLETMVVLLVGYLDTSGFEELLAMATTLSHNNNDVSILIKRSYIKYVANTFPQR
ncbi:PREDICTED: F-box/LRR-repeat protein At5g02910-like [Camelina sativa]|uniref:F-box/LRR-repeat protein At5g02910-like n=1 Tax=Camelina sativa TaxID=90675 RepID=A0ABM0TBN6_CAMSA|nr:PREDICTED: F-box/LRR-repeat protein At5g02910-like [Camelina sativa]